MNKDILPVFKTDASINRSLFIVDDTLEIKENAPISVFAACKESKIDKLVVLDNSFVNFPQLYKKCSKYDIKLIFGVNLTICNDSSLKNEESLSSNCKVSVVMKNSNAYQDLIKLHNAVNANAETFYYTTRGMWRDIINNWTDNLELVFPSYDNFLHKNLLENGECIPELGKIKPTLFYSNHGLPFDEILSERIIEFARNNGFNLNEVHNCYYYKDKHFKPYCVLRSIGERSKFNNPNVNFLCSDSFSVETYLRKVNQ